MRPRSWTAIVAIGLGVLFTLGQPSPSTADANVVCDVGGAVTGGVEAVTGGIIGGGNPAQDVCNTVTGAVGGVVKNPINDALKGIGNGIFEQITQWVSDGAAWLMGEVVKGIQQSTTPQLTAKGFLAQYAKMAALAALMAMAMLLLAVLEGVAQGNAGMLIRVVLVNLPLAFIATSVAYVVVQLLLVATDGMCDAISSAAGRNSQQFFQSAVKSLSDVGGTIGAAGGGTPASEAGGRAGVPLFVVFLAALIGAFAALMVWLELIMRDASVYVCAMFMPFSLAASIWPRWMGALRRSVELLLVVISSKFVIVAILSMAVAILADPGDGVEPILAASALMLISCFAPFLLMKFVPFAEGAMTAAYSRRSASGGAIGSVQLASDVAILRGMMRSNTGGDSGVSLWDAAERGGGGGGGGGNAGGRPGPDGPRGGVPTGAPGSSGGSAGVGSGGGAAAGGGAGGAASVAAAAPVAAQRGAQAAGKKLDRAGAGGEGQSGGSTAGSNSEGKPRSGQGASEGTREKESGKQTAEKPPRPASDQPGPKPEESR